MKKIKLIRKNRIPKTTIPIGINGSKNEIEICRERRTFILVKSAFFRTVFCCFLFIFSKAQTPTVSVAQSITVSGRVFDVNDSNALPAPLILNKRTEIGESGVAGGEFSLSGIQTDTFLITAGGYDIKRICFADSILKSVYTLKVGLSLKPNILRPVAIYPAKDLNAILKEREGLGVVQTRETVGITDAVESPITYMYERFSRDGKSRQAVAVMENKDKVNEVLKDLFRTYNKAGVISMDESEFDQFIAYLNIPESYLKTASDYELAYAIRQKYLQYR